MSALEPSLDEVEKAVRESLRDEPVAALATLDGDGCPATAFMHYTVDGLRVYIHTFTQPASTPPSSGAAASASPCFRSPGGFDERGESRSTQIKGHARAVTEAGKIAHAVSVMRARSAEPAQDSLLNNIKPPAAGGQQVFAARGPGQGSVGRPPSATAVAQGARLQRRRHSAHQYAPVQHRHRTKEGTVVSATALSASRTIPAPDPDIEPLKANAFERMAKGAAR